MKTRSLTLVLSALALATASFVANAADYVFNNATSISIADGCNLSGTCPGVANPYPSNIAVTGLSGDITQVSVTFHGLSHTFSNDLNFLLVSPGGQKVALLNNGGAGNNFVGPDITFTMSASAQIPTSGDIPGGSYLPSGANDRNSPAPAPTGPYSLDLSSLNGPGAAQNGSWVLYVSDHFSQDVGSIAGGWTLNITTSVTTTCASEGYTGTKLTWCKNICENGLTGATLDIWIHRWINRYRDLPYCAQEGGEEPPPPPPQEG